MDQKQSFQERLARIQVNGANPTRQAATMPEKPPAELPRRRPAKANVSPLPGWRENIRYPLVYVRAFLIGAFAVFVARYARFHIANGGLVGEDADLTMFIDGFIASAAGFAIKEVFRIEGKEFALAQTVGVVAMVVSMHNLAHWFPAPMSLVFSPEWVDDVLYYTEPNSILFRGVSFVIGDTGPSEPQMPTIIEIGQ